MTQTYEDLFRARAVAVTKPLIDGLEDAEDFMVYAGRVSNPSNQLNTETGDKLIKYLMRNGHWSVFETCNLVIEVETTRDIGRQVLRHTFKFQEFSQRYADPTQGLGFCLREARMQDHKNRQNSIECVSDVIAEEFAARQRRAIAAAQEDYEWSVSVGIAKEQARVFLPEGLTMSRMYVNGYARTWIHYCMARMDPSTQKEHRLLATECFRVLVEQFPVIGEAWESVK